MLAVMSLLRFHCTRMQASSSPHLDVDMVRVWGDLADNQALINKMWGPCFDCEVTSGLHRWHSTVLRIGRLGRCFFRVNMSTEFSAIINVVNSGLCKLHIFFSLVCNMYSTGHTCKSLNIIVPMQNVADLSIRSPLSSFSSHWKDSVQYTPHLYSVPYIVAGIL